MARLDGVRALAALSVACFHAWLYREDRPQGRLTEPLDQALFHASAGLICFFVLSGYLLYGAFARAALTEGARVAVRPYLRRRAARIVPAYWVCGAGCLVLYALVGFHAITPSAGELPLFALFLQNYSMATMGDLNPVTWTLGVEVAFYLLLPLVGWVAWRLGPRRRRAQVGLVLALIAISPAWELLALSQDWGGVAARALPAFLGSFGVGMLVALWAQRRATGERTHSPLRSWPTAALMAGAVALLVGDALLHDWGWWLPADILLSPGVQSALLGHLGAATGFALLVAAAACGSGPAVRWLGWRPLAAVGTASYGVYLWHLPLLLVAREAGLLPAALGPRLLVVLVLGVLAGAASWRWIERPCIERARTHRARSVRPQPRPSPVPARSA